MAETTNYKCPNCDGRLYFDGKIGLLKCEFCESTFTAGEVERIYAERQARDDARARAEQQVTPASAGAEGASAATVSAAEASLRDSTRVKVNRSKATDPVQAYLENSRWDDADSQNMRAYNCSSCGAQLMVDQVTAVTSCPYCGNNTVMPGQLSDVLKPDYVIPFKLDKDDAVAALKEYYGGKRFLPDGFTEGNHLEEVQGVYVPFWLYSGVADGDYHFHGAVVTTWSDKEKAYTQTDHYSLHRAGSMRFLRVPVDGSTRMPDEHMDAIEPYDYDELVEFSVAYLPGYVTDRYDLNVAECDERARGRVEATCLDALEQSTGGFAEVYVEGGSTNVRWRDVSYALLPVWMLHTRWNDNDYLFAMNGQTGRLIGDLPIDQGKVVRRFLILFVPTLVIIVLAVVFLFGGYTM